MKYTAKDLSSLLTANDRQNRTYTEKDVTPKMLSDFQKGMDKFLKEFPNYDIHNDEGDDKKADDAFIELFFDVIQDAGIDIFEDLSAYKTISSDLIAHMAELAGVKPEIDDSIVNMITKDVSAYAINGSNRNLGNIIKSLNLKDSDKIAVATFIKDHELNESKMKTKVNEAFVGDKVKTPSGKEGYITSITKDKTFVVTTDGKTEEIPAGESVEVTEATDYEENLPPRIPMFEDFKAARARKNKVNESLSSGDKTFLTAVKDIIEEAKDGEAGASVDDIYTCISKNKSKISPKILAEIEEILEDEDMNDYDVLRQLGDHITSLGITVKYDI